MSEEIGGLLLLPKNVPKNYHKLSYPVHDNDKVLIRFNKLHTEGHSASNELQQNVKCKLHSFIFHS